MAVYAAKEATTAGYPPSDWPPLWSWPGAPWPPGWPKDIEDDDDYPYSVDVTAPSNVYRGEAATTEIEVLASDTTSTDGLAGHRLKVTAKIGSTVVNVKKLTGDDYSTAIYYNIENYSGSQYGISEDIFFEVEPSDGGEELTITGEVTSVTPSLTGTDTVDVTACAITYAIEPTVVARDSGFLVTLAITNNNGILQTDLAPEVALVLTDAHASDVLSDVLVETGDWADGLWVESDLKITGGSGTDADTTIVATSELYTTGVTSEFTVIDLTPTLVFTVSPGDINRDENFSITVQAQDGAGGLISDATPLVSLGIECGDGNDIFKSTGKDWNAVTLVAGEWSTTTEQITNGTYIDSTFITAVAVDYVFGKTDTFTVTGGTAVVATSNVQEAHEYGIGSHAFTEAGRDAAWSEVRATIDGTSIAFSANTSIVVTSMGTHSYGSTNWRARASRSILRFVITPYKGTATDAVLRLRIWNHFWSGIVFYCDENERKNYDGTYAGTVQVHAVDVTGGTTFNDLVTGDILGSAYIDDMYPGAPVSNKHVRIPIGADVINNAPGNFLDIGLICSTDRSDTLPTYDASQGNKAGNPYILIPGPAGASTHRLDISP